MLWKRKTKRENKNKKHQILIAANYVVLHARQQCKTIDERKQMRKYAIEMANAGHWPPPEWLRTDILKSVRFVSKIEFYITLKCGARWIKGRHLSSSMCCLHFPLAKTYHRRRTANTEHKPSPKCANKPQHPVCEPLRQQTKYTKCSKLCECS